MKIPKSITVQALENDYSICAKSMNFEVPVAFRINSEVECYGKKLLSGWHKSAFSKIVFHVHNPVSEEVARASVIAALREIEKTEKLLVDLAQNEDYLIPLITECPIGCYWGALKLVHKKKPSNVTLLGDFITEIKDSFCNKVEDVRERIAELNRKENA